MHNTRSSPHQSALVEVRLYGHLRREFGRSYYYAVRDAAEAVRALCATVAGFQSYLVAHSEPGYRVLNGSAPVTIPMDMIAPADKVIRIVPVIGGRSGGGKLLAGIALIAVSFIPGLNAAVWSGVISASWSSIAFNIGLSLVIGGVSQMLAGSPPAPATQERVTNLPSYSFNGVINTVGEGNPVPIFYGELRVGSQVISTGISTAQL